jgi:hypothetical protein
LLAAFILTLLVALLLVAFFLAILFVTFLVALLFVAAALSLALSTLAVLRLVASAGHHQGRTCNDDEYTFHNSRVFNG